MTRERQGKGAPKTLLSRPMVQMLFCLQIYRFCAQSEFMQRAWIPESTVSNYLVKLLDLGLVFVAYREVSKSSGPRRKVYRLTTKGRAVIRPLLQRRILEMQIKEVLGI